MDLSSVSLSLVHLYHGYACPTRMSKDLVLSSLCRQKYTKKIKTNHLKLECDFDFTPSCTPTEAQHDSLKRSDRSYIWPCQATCTTDMNEHYDLMDRSTSLGV